MPEAKPETKMENCPCKISGSDLNTLVAAPNIMVLFAGAAILLTTWREKSIFLGGPIPSFGKTAGTHMSVYRISPPSFIVESFVT